MFKSFTTLAKILISINNVQCIYSMQTEYRMTSKNVLINSSAPKYTYLLVYLYESCKCHNILWTITAIVYLYNYIIIQYPLSLRKASGYLYRYVNIIIITHVSTAVGAG